MKVNDIYRSLFKTAGLRVTEDGFVRLEENGESIPATKDGMQAVIPIPAQLSSPHLNERLVMHLLSENVLEPESKELAFYRSLLIHRYNKVVATLITELLNLAASEAAHKNLNSDQADYLRLVPDVDGESVKRWTALVKAMPARQVQRAITHVYLKKAGTIDGKSFKRVAAVKFPLYEELAAWRKADQERQEDRQADREASLKIAKSKDTKGAVADKPAKKKDAKLEYPIFDVTIRKMDREPFMNLLEYLMGDIAKPDAYNYGSNSMMAPGLDALMHAFMNMAARVNTIIDLFDGTINGIKELRFDSEWVPAFENIDLLWDQVRDIPRLTSANVPATPAAPAAAPAQQAPVAAPAAPQQPPQPLPWAAPQQPVAQPGAGQYVNGQWVPAAPAWQPAQPQQPQQQQPAPSSGGVSAADLFRANPAVAGAAMILARWFLRCTRLSR
jgi:hypothetical protein